MYKIRNKNSHGNARSIVSISKESEDLPMIVSVMYKIMPVSKIDDRA
jgi:hypothetical protein